MAIIRIILYIEIKNVVLNKKKKGTNKELILIYLSKIKTNLL